jgi:copper chaperone CopZ
MKGKSFVLGSTLAAFLASLCCLGPLVLGGIGIGTALVATFAPLRPFFLALSGVLLALGFYLVYRHPKASPACEGEICAPESRASRVAKPLLWLATLATTALALFPVYGGRLVRARTGAAPVATARLETVQLRISGMVCEACAGVVRSRLVETAGVAEAEVDYPSGHARIQYDPSKVAPAQLLEAVNATGYKASVAEH